MMPLSTQSVTTQKLVFFVQVYIFLLALLIHKRLLRVEYLQILQLDVKGT